MLMLSLVSVPTIRAAPTTVEISNDAKGAAAYQHAGGKTPKTSSSGRGQKTDADKRL